MTTPITSSGRDRTGDANILEKEGINGKQEKIEGQEQEQKEKNNSTNNQVKHLGLMKNEILKSITTYLIQGLLG